MSKKTNPNWISDLSIRNFKSIKSVDMKCGRINVLIGRPNVGKSNVLEAIGALGWGFRLSGDRFGSGTLRYEAISNLFYDQRVNSNISIETNLSKFVGRKGDSKNSFLFLQGSPRDVEKVYEGDRVDTINSQRKHDLPLSLLISCDQTGRFNNELDGDYKRNTNPFSKLYRFKAFKKNESQKFFFLDYPHGENLVSIFETTPELRKEVAQIFGEYGLKLILDPQEGAFEILKLTDDIAIKTPFSLIADTLQRYIFHLAAIHSNRDSVILFEEPENHSYPPYVKMLAERMVEAETNQFFMTSHSPYLLNTMMSYSDEEDVAIHVVTYEDHKTGVRTLTLDEVRQIMDYGMDVFFNLERYEDG